MVIIILKTMEQKLIKIITIILVDRVLYSPERLGKKIRRTILSSRSRIRKLPADMNKMWPNGSSNSSLLLIRITGTICNKHRDQGRIARVGSCLLMVNSNFYRWFMGLSIIKEILLCKYQASLGFMHF